VSARPIGDLMIARKATSHAFEQFVRQLRACRECGDTAAFFDNICRHCGAANPVKIPVSASVMVTAVAAQMAIVFLQAI
jgi:predicted amidophosphoribosyltransferase